jgi:hypothetical protein
LDDASAPSATGGCADALKSAQLAVATALRAVIEEGLERLNALTEAAPKNLFQFSFVCLRRCH